MIDSENRRFNQNGRHQVVAITHMVRNWKPQHSILVALGMIPFSALAMASSAFLPNPVRVLGFDLHPITAMMVVGIALLMSLVGLSPALGTFLAGLLLSDTEYRPQIESDIEPFKGLLLGLFVFGIGKAAVMPVHRWLPAAMVAPTPVSALLHAVAVVKAGAFGIVRVVYDVYGISFASELKVLLPLAVIASITIIYGSVHALFQDDLKKRLAYSTVSQVSYITLGTAVLGPVASIGGIVHLVHQGVMKITLFFCAGNYAETLGIHHVSEMHGTGRRMPWTTAAFTLGALGMIGVPPLAGFISKWYLGYGALVEQQGWVIWVLMVSGLLNAAYFLPILYAAWFRQPADTWPKERDYGRYETHWMLLLPPVITALLALLIGLFAQAPYSALEWARLIISREYAR